MLILSSAAWPHLFVAHRRFRFRFRSRLPWWPQLMNTPRERSTNLMHVRPGVGILLTNLSNLQTKLIRAKCFLCSNVEISNTSLLLHPSAFHTTGYKQTWLRRLGKVSSRGKKTKISLKDISRKCCHFSCKLRLFVLGSLNKRCSIAPYFQQHKLRTFARMTWNAKRCYYCQGIWFGKTERSFRARRWRTTTINYETKNVRQADRESGRQT